MADLFKYKPLQGDNLQIRVLHLTKNSGNSLVCRVEHVHVTENSFTALSYVWGNPEQKFRIKVTDGDQNDLGYIPLTQNLKDALFDLRDSPGVQEGTFWIDQICINQQDDAERGHQVALMAQVYSKAARVITYIGPREPTDAKALALHGRINAHFEPHWETYDLAHPIGKGSNYEHTKDRPKCLRFKLHEDDVDFVALVSILYGTWAQRLWLIQENILNQITDLLRGLVLIPNTKVHQFFALAFVGLIPIPAGKAAITVSQCAIMQRRKEGLTDSLLALVLVIAASNACSDPRDKIYALLSIAEDTERLF